MYLYIPLILIFPVDLVSRISFDVVGRGAVSHDQIGLLNSINSNSGLTLHVSTCLSRIQSRKLLHNAAYLHSLKRFSPVQDRELIRYMPGRPWHVHAFLGRGGDNRR